MRRWPCFSLPWSWRRWPCRGGSAGTGVKHGGKSRGCCATLGTCWILPRRNRKRRLTGRRERNDPQAASPEKRAEWFCRCHRRCGRTCPAPPGTATDAHAAKVSGLFARIVKWYDPLNRLLSLGLDQGWRKCLADAVLPAAPMSPDARKMLVKALQAASALLHAIPGATTSAKIIATTSEHYKISQDEVRAIMKEEGIRL